jgi:site-specific DNA recombinase
MPKPIVANGLPTQQVSHVALYMRVSSDDQAEHGNIDTQRDFLRQFAHLYSLPIVEEYEDAGITGTLPLSQRPAGRRLLDDAQQGRFGCVLVYRVDRLGRSLTALLEAHTVLSQAGITIRSATEPFDTSTPIGTFLFQLLGSLAELDKATIIERMTLGRDRVARSGKWTGGIIPLGYDVDAEGWLVPSTRAIEQLGMTEAALVQDLFQRIANGSTALAECHRLNALGIVTARRYSMEKVVNVNAPWRPSRLNRVFNNPVYLGTHPLKSKHGRIDRAVEPLVDQATWGAVQAQLRRNQCLPKNTVHRLYLLRSLITCGLCGSRYIGTPVSRQGKRSGRRVDYYYRCNSQTTSTRPEPEHRCAAKILKAEWLEDLIWQDCRAFILHPGAALAEARRQLEARRQQSPLVIEEHRRLQQALGEKALERDQILTLFRRKKIALEEAEKQLDAIEHEANALRTALSAIQAQRDLADAFAAHYHEATTLLERLRDRLEMVEASNDTATKRQVVELLVAGIQVDTVGTGKARHAKITITYTFSPKRAVDFTTSYSSSPPPQKCRPRQNGGPGRAN